MARKRELSSGSEGLKLSEAFIWRQAFNVETRAMILKSCVGPLEYLRVLHQDSGDEVVF